RRQAILDYRSGDPGFQVFTFITWLLPAGFLSSDDGRFGDILAPSGDSGLPFRRPWVSSFHFHNLASTSRLSFQR
ncbi:hypothetical protein, partial [Escherichia coli]|uniref:hypothetical protein n=1 Tax=Escherichia coli TaxID=562 RepID=UPI001BC89302